MDQVKLWLLPSRAMNRRLWPLFVGAGYITIIGALGGLKAQHVVIGSLALLDLYNERARAFLKYFLPFILTGVIYDSMRYYYWWGIEGHIHVAEPYFLEKSLFGITSGGKVLTPNEYFDLNHTTALDLVTGFAYLVFVLEYLLAAFLLFFLGKRDLLTTFGWCFVVVNVMGFATYYIYPAAPPWYVTQYGLGPARMDVQPFAAAAQRFDAFFGTGLFAGIYGQGVDVYGAFPSLHVSYPLLVSWVALKTRRLLIPAIGFYFLMCFSAIYLQHHYIIDVVLGTLYALVALAFVVGLQRRRTLAQVPGRSRDSVLPVDGSGPRAVPVDPRG